MGISTVQLQMLDFIFNHGRCTRSQCAYELYISGSAVSRIIDQLEKKGLLVPQNKEPHDPVCAAGVLIVINAKEVVAVDVV
ncbi:MarR family transcriptional regulator [Pseudomonas syringae]|uniref:MarR family transcriptional regulator n=1 Tax=Pseudomonas syringae TaxID=317 RepID=UPI002E3582CA|nr:MarR family transcriptional regulator [Pseudomonas syringae]